MVDKGEWRNMMRDPKRIHLFLVELEALWLEYPDLRLGQLIVYILTAPGAFENLFYIEDEKMLQLIRQLKGVAKPKEAVLDLKTNMPLVIQTQEEHEKDIKDLYG